MVKVTINGKCVQLPRGVRLSQALEPSVSMPCGGRGRCGKCRVKAYGALSPLTSEEKKMLSAEEIAAGIRLACCARAEGDVRLETVAAGIVSQICIESPGCWHAPEPLFSHLGAAVDVGTTTLAAQLYSRDGLVAAAAAPNPQAAFGADVITRIGYAMEGGAKTAANCVRKAINDLLRNMCGSIGKSQEDIDGLVITGNTAMLYLLTMEDPRPLSAAPFDTKERFGKSVTAAALGLVCAPKTEVYLPRCISAFVGADITMALLASDICDKETAMLVDIGTNGEMVLQCGGTLLCCSTAAGPAFEGANLSQGMQGGTGAIDHAKVENGSMRVYTIDNAEAVGICGSGIVDVLACLLKLERLDETGMLDEGKGRYAITESVAITQEDVRQVQLAKSAISAGLETLLHLGGVRSEEVSLLEVAGGFGSFLDLDSAGEIGLLPACLCARSRVLGNAALAGAAMLLGDRKLLEKSSALADSVKTVDLSTNAWFMDAYMKNMFFPVPGSGRD